MLDFKTPSFHFQIHHGPNIPMQQLHKHKFDEDMKVVLEFDLKNSHLRFSLIFLREYFEGMSPKQRVDFTEILAVHIGHPISLAASFPHSRVCCLHMVGSKVRQRGLFRQQMGYATKMGGQFGHLDISSRKSMMRIYEQLFVLVKQVLIYFIIISFQLFFFVFLFFSRSQKNTKL